MEAKKITVTTINLSLKTLTPVHIGSGNELKLGIDYFYEDKKAGKADFNKMSGYIKDVNDWTNKIMKGENIFESLAYKGVKLEDICSEILPVKAHKGSYLFEFIRNQKTREPIIPGSSVKGAIRTALLTPALEKYYNDKAGEIIKKYHVYKKYDDRLLQPILELKPENKPNPQNNIFKFVQISDASARLSNLSVDIFQTLNMDSDENWYIKESLTQNREVFEGAVSFSLRIDERFFQKNNFNITDLKDFFNTIHNHTMRLLNKEIENFESDLKDGFFKQTDIGKEIINQLQNIKSQAENKEGSFLLRMSAGSGWDYMTGAWFKKITDDNQWDDFKKLIRPKYANFPFPKTRRLTSDLKMPGFVLLSIN